jgi:hypothetical protein
MESMGVVLTENKTGYCKLTKQDASLKIMPFNIQKAVKC